ncbi:hypothetical protein G7Z17_g45 [Cylindrodendrum hubeiense]|uniref:ASST-domain-containing protein n=1 Tax=Cylindrodendrum hubeiense TaxID=595255 RepID=A0A9P5HL35_9HYPO|nr:hypothetical protein G7Z17_g45 [Cylindrodendrum hubeiense]
MLCHGSTRALAGIAALLPLLSPAVADAPIYTDLESYQNGSFGQKPLQKFHSAPLIGAPIYQLNSFDHDEVDGAGYLFMTGAYGERFGPSIVSAKDLSLIWADERFWYSQAAETNMFKNQRVMSVFVERGVRIINEHYQPLYYVRPQGDLVAYSGDSHEAHLTMDDTVVMIVCPEKNVNLTMFGGLESDAVLNCHVQEVDPVDNKVLFQFSTLDFFDVTDTYWQYNGTGVYDLGTKAFDFCHMNSVQKTPDGDFLISYRHFSSIILVDGKTKMVKWVMGGKRNQFKDISTRGRSAVFAFQHQPRLTGRYRFTVFDNAGLDNGFCAGRTCSRGLELEYDPVKKEVWVVEEWYHPQDIMSISRGGVQRLPNGNTLVAWGQNPMITEHTPEGKVVMDFQRSQVIHHDHGFPSMLIYRAMKGDWEGKPTWGPNISATVEVEGGPKKIFVSWNGATAVDQWVLIQSNDMDALTGSGNVIAQSPRMGFETSFDIPFNSTFARVAALDINGTIIGSTPAVEISTGQLHKLDYEIIDLVLEEPNSPDPTTTAEPVIITHTPTPTPSPVNHSGSQWVDDTGSSLTVFYVGAALVLTLAL